MQDKQSEQVLPEPPQPLQPEAPAQPETPAKKERRAKLTLALLLLIFLAVSIPVSLALQWIDEDPQRLELILQSARDGEIIEDAVDVLMSRLDQSETTITLKEQIELTDNWVTAFDNVEVFMADVEGIPTNIGFFDITTSARMIQIDKADPQAPLPSLLHTMQHQGAFFTLPYIQTSFEGYSLYTATKDEFGILTPISPQGPSEYRGRLVITQAETGERRTQILLPGELQTLLENPNQVETVMEYPFTVDSRTLQSDLEELASYNSPSGKVLSNVATFTTLIVSFYNAAGEVQSTEVVSAFQLFDTATQTFAGEKVELKVPALLELAVERQHQLGAEYFVAGLPDTGTNSSMVTPIGGSIQQVLRAQEGEVPSIISPRHPVRVANGQFAEERGEGAFVQFGGDGGIAIPAVQRFMLVSMNQETTLQPLR